MSCCTYDTCTNGDNCPVRQTPLEALHAANRDVFPLEADTPRRPSWLYWTVLAGSALAAGIGIYLNF